MEPPGIWLLTRPPDKPSGVSQPFYTLHATAEPTEKVTEEQRRLITPAYTYIWFHSLVFGLKVSILLYFDVLSYG